MSRREKKRRGGWISLAHLRSIEADKLVRDRAQRGEPVVEPVTYVQPLAHIYRCLLSEKDKTAEVNIAAVVKALVAWARVHRFSFTDEQILKAARKAVEHPRVFSADGLARWLRVSYAERQRVGLKTIGAHDVPRAERDRRWREQRNQQRREEYASERDKRGGPNRQQWLAANSKSRDKPWEAAGLSRATWYRRAGEPVRQQPVRQVFGRVSKKGFTAPVRQPVSPPPRPAAPPLSGLPIQASSSMPYPTSTWSPAAMTTIPESSCH